MRSYAELAYIYKYCMKQWDVTVFTSFLNGVSSNYKLTRFCGKTHVILT